MYTSNPSQKQKEMNRGQVQVSRRVVYRDLFIYSISFNVIQPMCLPHSATVTAALILRDPILYESSLGLWELQSRDFKGRQATLSCCRSCGYWLPFYSTQGTGGFSKGSAQC
jgi:hypothetical protein